MVVKVGKVTKELEAFIRKDLSGIIIGGLELEPKDIETIDDVADYFLSRGILSFLLLLFFSF